jgi:hypothetical protein
MHQLHNQPDGRVVVDMGLLVLQQVTNADSQDPCLHFGASGVIWPPFKELHRLVLVEGIELGLAGHPKRQDILQFFRQSFRSKSCFQVLWIEAIGKELCELVRIRSSNQARAEFIGNRTEDL